MGFFKSLWSDREIIINENSLYFSQSTNLNQNTAKFHYISSNCSPVIGIKVSPLLLLFSAKKGISCFDKTLLPLWKRIPLIQSKIFVSVMANLCEYIQELSTGLANFVATVPIKIMHPMQKGLKRQERQKTSRKFMKLCRVILKYIE